MGDAEQCHGLEIRHRYGTRAFLEAMEFQTNTPVIGIGSKNLSISRSPYPKPNL
jgi:hypothetical protein